MTVSDYLFVLLSLSICVQPISSYNLGTTLNFLSAAIQLPPNTNTVNKNENEKLAFKATFVFILLIEIVRVWRIYNMLIYFILIPRCEQMGYYLSYERFICVEFYFMVQN